MLLPEATITFIVWNMFFLDSFKLKVGQAKNGHIISLAATFNLLTLEFSGRSAI